LIFSFLIGLLIRVIAINFGADFIIFLIELSSAPGIKPGSISGSDSGSDFHLSAPLQSVVSYRSNAAKGGRGALRLSFRINSYAHSGFHFCFDFHRSALLSCQVRFLIENHNGEAIIHDKVTEGTLAVMRRLLRVANG
jgi:hypothetical protein